MKDLHLSGGKNELPVILSDFFPHRNKMGSQHL